MLWAIQKALDLQLYNNITYNGSVVEVYDTIPEQYTFPYIKIGEDTVNAWNTKLSYGKDMTHTLHVFSQKSWKQEVKEIMYQVERQLRGSFFVDGYEVITEECEFQEVFEESDNTIQHGVIRFRFRVEE